MDRNQKKLLLFNKMPEHWHCRYFLQSRLLHELNYVSRVTRNTEESRLTSCESQVIFKRDDYELRFASFTREESGVKSVNHDSREKRVQWLNNALT